MNTELLRPEMKIFLTNQWVGGSLKSTIPPTPLNNAHQGGFSFVTLAKCGLRGFTRSNLFQIRKFYETYQEDIIVAPVVRQLLQAKLHEFYLQSAPDDEPVDLTDEGASA